MIAGEQSQLAVTLTNHSVGTSRNTLVTLTLPASFTLLDSDPVGTEIEDGLSYSFGLLPGGETRTISFTVLPTEVGIFTVTASAAALNPDPVSENNSATLEFDLTVLCGVLLRPALLMDPDGGNNAIVWQALAAGESPNITVTYLHTATPNLSLEIQVSGTAITVRLATDGASAITSTANQIAAAVAASGAASALVTAVVLNSDDKPSLGDGVVTALPTTALQQGGGDTLDCYLAADNITTQPNAGTGWGGLWTLGDATLNCPAGDDFDAYSTASEITEDLDDQEVSGWSGTAWSGSWLHGDA